MKRSLLLSLIVMVIGFTAFALAPIQVTVENTTDFEAAINYKYNGDWAYPYSESMWKMLNKGIEETEWLIIPPGKEIKLLMDRGRLLRLIKRHEHNNMWYTHVQIPQQAWVEGQRLKIRQF